MRGKAKMEFFDSHAHYNDEKFDADRQEILKQIYNSHVKKVICAGYSVESSKKAVQIAKTEDFVYAIVGISPNDIPQCHHAKEEKQESRIFENQLQEQLRQIETLAKQEKVVAIGEIGLDYYWNKENKENQKITFQKQIKLANKLGLPIVIHTREAIYDTLEILKGEEKLVKKRNFPLLSTKFRLNKRRP